LVLSVHIPVWTALVKTNPSIQLALEALFGIKQLEEPTGNKVPPALIISTYALCLQSVIYVYRVSKAVPLHAMEALGGEEV
jgi:hypothetical protein